MLQKNVEELENFKLGSGRETIRFQRQESIKLEIFYTNKNLKKNFWKTNTVILDQRLFSKTRSNTCCPRFECCVTCSHSPEFKANIESCISFFNYEITEMTDRLFSSH